VSDNAELGSNPVCVTAADIEYVRKPSEVFDLLEPVLVNHLFGEDALQLSSKESDDPPSDAESDAKAKAEVEVECEYDSERQPEGDDGAGDIMGVDDGTYVGVVQAGKGKGDDAVLER
jgi:hypothetical protein